MTTDQITEDPDDIVDARGATCPGPLMDLIGELRAVETGTIVALLSDNENSTTEVQEWTDQADNEVTALVDKGGYYRIHVKKL
ncbi:sulfurtransferase TusA family protein [Haloarcula laminariae]|uniref:sulfurtransferase TusA family protein n=1 Tax=Haloarcula laminariae TaxID=2961577 RepID=UPI002405EE58|nr:sulfurtransferase TusA family protein [Halomicroarcula sp. FL173]